MFGIIKARAYYHQGFQDGYSAGRFAVAQQVQADIRRALLGSPAGFHGWLEAVADNAFAMAGTAGDRPPWSARDFHTPPGHLLAAAGSGGAGLRGASGHPITDLAGFARSVGEADGRTLGRYLTVRGLYRQAEQSIGRRNLTVDGTPADRWLFDARRRWLAAASAGPSPLPGTRAEVVYRDLASETGRDPGRPQHHQQPRPPHAAARPAPGAAAAGHRPVAGGTPVIRPAVPTPPLHPPGPGR